jgi:hypothetical protein
MWAERLLPLAYGEQTSPHRSRRQRLLSAIARWRCRTGLTTLPVEAHLLGNPAQAMRTTWLA